MARNRFHLYISPIIVSYGNTFRQQFKLVLNNVVGFSVLDYKYYKVKGYESIKPLIFILINKEENEKNFREFLSYIRKYSGFVDDYSENLGNLHWVILEVSDRFKPAHAHWTKGEYSQMYSDKDLKDLGIYETKDGKVSQLYLILTKHPQGLENFKKLIEVRFGTSTIPDNPNEYDIPPVWKEEIYNFEPQAINLIK